MFALRFVQHPATDYSEHTNNKKARKFLPKVVREKPVLVLTLGNETFFLGQKSKV